MKFKFKDITFWISYTFLFSLLWIFSLYLEIINFFFIKK
jgi:hypothetical protein